MSIYLTSDWHFCHDRDFIYKPRGFASVQEMNEAIVKRFNEVVREDDICYVLGDLMLNDDAEGMRLLAQLNGRLRIIRGNHDTSARLGLYLTLPNVESIENAAYLQHGKYNFYLSHYPTLTTNFEDDKKLWQRVLNLHGHTHSPVPLQEMRYNVAVDAHNCYPVNIEEIIKAMK